MEEEAKKKAEKEARHRLRKRPKKEGKQQSRVEQQGRGRGTRRPWGRVIACAARREGLSACPQLRIRWPPVQHVN